MNELLLVVTIGGERVALPAVAVESVVELDTLIPVPRAAPHIAGLSALRSRVLTVIDFMRSLELGDSDCSDGIREAAVVDTGVGGSADEIGAVLDQAGPRWGGVRHVVLTHKHPDHAGSIGDVLTAATRATGYVGAEDLSAVDAPRTLKTLGDGDEVFGLQVVATPGHTAGHLAVFDADTGVLVAGDALTNMAGLAGSNPQFTEDKAAAVASVRKLSKLSPRTILVGHGDPLTSGAAGTLQKLASSLA